MREETDTLARRRRKLITAPMVRRVEEAVSERIRGGRGFRGGSARSRPRRNRERTRGDVPPGEISPYAINPA